MPTTVVVLSEDQMTQQVSHNLFFQRECFVISNIVWQDPKV